MIRRPPARLAAGVVGALLLGLGAAAAQPGPSPQPGPPPAPPAKARPSKDGSLAGDRSQFPFFPLRPVWSVDAGGQPAAPGATNAAHAIVPFTNGAVIFFDLATGGAAFTTQYRTTFAPVADGPRVLMTGDRVIDALSAADGSAVWKAPLAGPAAFAPVARAGWAFVPLAGGELSALRTDTGTIVWTTPLGPPSAVPVVEGDRVYAATTSGTVHALAVNDGKAVWQVAVEGSVTALAAVEGHVFVATSGRWLYALDGRGRVRWRFRLQGAAIGLAVDEDRVVAVMLDQSVRAFKIGNGAQAWRRELSFRPAAGPVVTGASLLVSGYSPSVRIIDRRTGANQGVYAMPLPVEPGALTLETLAAGPLVVPGATVFDDRVILMTQHGYVHAARRMYDEPASTLTAWPTAALPAPAPPPGYVEPAPAATPTPDPAPAAPPATPPAPPSGGTPSRTPPTPPAR